VRETFGFTLKPGQPFASLRTENTLIDRFFERLENDPKGGEGGKRIAQVTSRPVFGLTSGRMRAATWFDVEHRPQGVVWLLAAEMHDERHKGKSDAYDIMGQLDAAGRLFPQRVDYKWLELDRRRLDTESFAADVRSDARALVEAAQHSGRDFRTVASVPVRANWEASEGGLSTLYVAVSLQPVRGERSGLEFPMTNDRFLLVAEGIRQAGEDVHGPEVLVDEVLRFPEALPPLTNERGFVVVFENA